MPLKIVHSLNYMRKGGITNMVHNLAKYSKHNHTYVCFDCGPYLIKKFNEINVEVAQVGDNAIDAAIQYMRDNADIVHAQSSGGPEPGVHIGLKSGKPIVETCQAPGFPQGTIYEHIKVIAVSAGILDQWPPELKPSRVIYSCASDMHIDVDKTECKTMFGFDPNRPVVGRIGRLEGLKRPQDFVNAAELIGRERPDVQFLLVGDGSDGDGIRHKAHILARARDINIKMPGFLIGDEKKKAINAMDAFLYPTSQEGFGISFAEAMSIGLPIVTYSDSVNIDVVGPAGLFTADNEYTTASKPFHGLARLTVDLLENDRAYDLLSEYGKRRYNERYRPEIMAAQYDELYEEMV